MENKAWLRLMAMMLVLPLAVACAQEEETEADIEVETEPTGAPAAPVTVQINPQGGSMLTGDVTATHEAERTTVRINLAGLTEGEDYEAAIRYGDCTVAANFLTDDDEPATGTGAAPATGEPGMAEHEPGDEVADIDLTVTGTTATGTADIGNDELSATESAYLVVTQGEMMVGCADLSGHGSMGGMGTTPAPGAAMPADSAHR